MPEEICRYLEWDSRFFGKNIGRVNGTRLTQDQMPGLLDWCRRQRIDCLYFLADPGHPETAQLAGAHGFELVDIRVTFERVLSGSAGTCLSAFPEGVRRFQPSDLPALRELSGRVYEDTRFFFDPRFPRERSRELYRTWIQASCENPQVQVFVAGTDRVEGYLAASRNSKDTMGQIELIAVDAGAQGRGVARALVTAALNEFLHQGMTRVRVVTQGRNLRAQRLYQRCGFVTESLQVWYHLWLNHLK